MTGRMPPQSRPEDDLENTAELPALDLGALEAAPAWLRARVGPSGGRSSPGDAHARLGEGEEEDEEDEDEDEEADADAEEASQGPAREPLDRGMHLEQLRYLEQQRAVAEERATQLAQELHERQQSEQTLRDALDQAETRIQELLAMAGRHSAALTEADAELARLRGAAAEEAAVLQESLRQRDILEAELALVRKELRQVAGAGAGEAQEAALQVLQAQLDAKEQALQSLQESAHTNAAWQRELQSEMRAAEDQLRRKDAELEEAHTQLAQARESEAQQRAAAREALNREREARALAAERDGLLQGLCGELQSLKDDAGESANVPATPTVPERPQGGSWQMPAAVTRLLVRTDSDSEIAHVLGDRTSIGRSADNDLQVDVSSISRHHALIIAQAAQTVIEDLHSTNGVRVNGRRVKRQPLRDGDTVVIGKAQFRFVLRAVVEAE